jgi:hypothetical protein
MTEKAQDQIEMLELAQEKLNEALELIGNVVGNDRNTEAYLLNGLNHMANDSGNPYDLSIPKLIEQIREDPEVFNFNG